MPSSLLTKLSKLRIAGPTAATKGKRAKRRRAARALSAAFVQGGKRRPTLGRTGGYSFKNQGGTELNFVDVDISRTPNPTPVLFQEAGQVVLLNGMMMGTDASTRIGRRIVIRSIEWKMTMTGSDVNHSSTLYRFAIVYDSQTNGLPPSVADIYSSAIAGVSCPPAQTPRNISNKARFQVLYDSGLHKVVGNNAIVVPIGVAPYDINFLGNLTDNTCNVHQGYLKIKKPVQYNSGNAGTVGDIQTGGLFFVAMGQRTGSGGPPVTNLPTKLGYVRIPKKA